MVLDSSAIVAISLDEAEAEALILKVRSSSLVAVGAPTLVETGLVLTSRLGGEALLERFMRDHQVQVLPFGEGHWSVAIEAFKRFGKGRHPAKLNLGDCYSYATAKVAGEPLLYVSADFSQTDLERA
ncbi:MAG: type II toxin-antitoxin system VapC family toxin [Deinococcota bacterium]|nr:type II toxin-antitoxin system VapC family toxin [Deinococcota bacterium]